MKLTVAVKTPLKAESSCPDEMKQVPFVIECAGIVMSSSLVQVSVEV